MNGITTLIEIKKIIEYANKNEGVIKVKHF